MYTLQYFGHLMRRVDSLEKTLMLGGIGGRRRRGWDGWMASLTRWIWFWVNSRSLWLTGMLGMLRFRGSQRVGHDWATELNWTDWNLRKEIYYNEAAHVTMKAEKSYLSFQSWIFRKVRVCRFENLTASGIDSCLGVKVWEAGVQGKKKVDV